MTLLKNGTALAAIKERTASRQKNSGEIRKQLFWKTAINDQRSKQKLKLNAVEI